MNDHNSKQSLTPRFQPDLKIILAVSIIISAIYVSLSFIFFMNSGARTTISEINAGMNLSNPYHSDIDTTKPIKANDIDAYASSINSKIQNLDNNNDFGKNSVSDKTLGL